MFLAIETSMTCSGMFQPAMFDETRGSIRVFCGKHAQNQHMDFGLGRGKNQATSVAPAQNLAATMAIDHDISEVCGKELLEFSG